MFSYQAAKSQISKWEVSANGAIRFDQLKCLLDEIDGLSEDEYIESMAEEVRSAISQRMLNMALAGQHLSFEDLKYMFDSSDYYGGVSEEESRQLLERMEKCASNFFHFMFLFRRSGDAREREFLVRMKDTACSKEEVDIVTRLACLHGFHDVVGL